jgi:predicted nucleotidyltransferase
MLNKIISEKQPLLQTLCKRYKISALYAFGSVNTPRFNAASDIDILVSFDKNISMDEYAENYFLVHDQLSAMFGRKIDLVTENSLSNPYFIKEIEQTKKLIYAA